MLAVLRLNRSKLIRLAGVSIFGFFILTVKLTCFSCEFSSFEALVAPKSLDRFLIFLGDSFFGKYRGASPSNLMWEFWLAIGGETLMLRISFWL